MVHFQIFIIEAHQNEIQLQLEQEQYMDQNALIVSNNNKR